MRELEMSAKTVEEAVQAACDALGVDRDDLNVSYEVLTFPEKKLFRSVPAKVRVTVADTAQPEAAPAPAAAPAPRPAPAAPKAEAPAPAEAAPAEKAPAPAPAAPAPAQEAQTVPMDLSDEPRLQAAVDYLKPIFAMLGAEDAAFTAVKQGEAIVLRVEGGHLGTLIGRRGETMEALSYLASLVVNRAEGPYLKLGLDVGGYRGKREADLRALAKRMAERVARSGYSFELEPMNPYERHIVHTAVGEMEGVRSESKGEGLERRVVIYSTAPGASNLPDRGGYRGPHSARGDRPYGDRRPRSGRGYDRGGRDRYGDRRGPRRNDRSDRGPRGPRGGRGPRPSGVPEREFADRTLAPDAQPTVPGRSSRIHDGDEFAFGKIEL